MDIIKAMARYVMSIFMFYFIIMVISLPGEFKLKDMKFADFYSDLKKYGR